MRDRGRPKELRQLIRRDSRVGERLGVIGIRGVEHSIEAITAVIQASAGNGLVPVMVDYVACTRLATKAPGQLFVVVENQVGRETA
ncbi:hypothetical protein KPB2_5538 [Klebsiella pneumoniae Kb677]|nr:hypothetical protein KPB2_5538 [Klebsiella pneumoniae Kb677]